MEQRPYSQHTSYVGQARPGEGQAELPLGFGMALAQDGAAMSFFGSLTSEQQQEVVAYIKNSTSGEDAKARISHMVAMMHRHDDDFSDL